MDILLDIKTSGAFEGNAFKDRCHPRHVRGRGPRRRRGRESEAKSLKALPSKACRIARFGITESQDSELQNRRIRNCRIVGFIK